MCTHSIQLNTRDGAQLRFDCQDDQYLLEAAEDAKIGLPAICREGSCGACYAVVTQGEYALGEHNPATLSAEQKAQGGTLLCRTLPKSPLTIALPFEQDRISFSEIPIRNAEITALDTIAENTVRLVLQLFPDDDGGCGAQFEAGQFVELEIPETGLKRAYSLANTSNWEGRLECLIRLQAQGQFSSWLRQAQVGDALIVHGPQGAFGLNANSLRPRWFVAGGTGLAPMLSMLRHIAEFQDLQPTRLYFGVNRPEELFCLDELAELKALLPQFKPTVCVWKPEANWQGFSGTPIDALAQDLAKEPSLPDLYLCGPPALIDAAEALASRLNIPPEQVISERFLPT